VGTMKVVRCIGVVKEEKHRSCFFCFSQSHRQNATAAENILRKNFSHLTVMSLLPLGNPVTAGATRALNMVLII